MRDSEQTFGDFFICRPTRRHYDASGDALGFRLMSDLHIGAPNIDYGLIGRELAQARKDGDRILLNGDILDCIVPQDRKRFTTDSLHPRLKGRRDVLNAQVEWAAEILTPYADLIDMMGIGNHECFDSETEVLTSDGWLLFSELTPEHEVASYKKEDGAIEFRKPTAVHRYLHQGDMVKLSTSKVDLLVTPNHRLLFKDKSRHVVKDAKIRKPGQGSIAKNSAGWYWIISVNGKPVRGKAKASREEAVSDLEASGHMREYVPLAGNWRMREAGNMPSMGIKLPSSGVVRNEDFPLVADEEIRATAWILTDGWVSSTRGYHVCQRVSKAGIVREVLNSNGWDYSESVRVRNTKAICGRQLKKESEPSVEFYIRKEGTKRLRELIPHKESLPKWLWSCSKRQFDIFLSSYIDGDGSRHKSSPDTSLMVYGRRHLMDDLQALCVCFGYRTSLVEHRQDDWRLNITPRQTAEAYPENFSTEKYDGMVYCVTTHNDTVVVRRNGKVVITGNSAIEKHHAADVGKLLLYELEKAVRDEGIDHVIHFGGYTGFVSYQIARRVADTDRFDNERAFHIYYHHGAGGDSPVTTGTIDMSRKASWVDADVIWMGHKHVRINRAVQTLSCPRVGYRPKMKEVRHIITGSYFDTYRGQTQQQYRRHGRHANYAADAGMMPHGKGGCRLELCFRSGGAGDHYIRDMRVVM